MLTINSNKTSLATFAKLNELCDFLFKEKKEYEQIAFTIPNKEFRRVILTLALQSNQYAHEITSQIQILGGKSLILLEHFEDRDSFGPVAGTENLPEEKEVLTFCELKEKKMISTYREILNEPYLYEGLREMIRYQLNGILCTFVQLKLLHVSVYDKSNNHI